MTPDKFHILDAFCKTKSHFRNTDIVINIVEPVEAEKWETHLKRNVVSTNSSFPFFLMDNGV